MLTYADVCQGVQRRGSTGRQFVWYTSEPPLLHTSQVYLLSSTPHMSDPPLLHTSHVGDSSPPHVTSRSLLSSTPHRSASSPPHLTRRRLLSSTPHRSLKVKAIIKVGKGGKKKLFWCPRSQGEWRELAGPHLTFFEFDQVTKLVASSLTGCSGSFST